ncbi:hypothetical protein DV702_06175 [Sporosarcina sp. PTS2304]|uniref:hypothetical protein n=1 Tax=Sporosarcina sp. PTS2304 TaxID=2283194 RepID=UPI000E0D7A01|nr:hypothetical protein [Sporosarcina sp. PTS2304]AXH99365.1 hypothetical protein DV702_06175 [Sporosarcina sp. PTS2304]
MKDAKKKKLVVWSVVGIGIIMVAIILSIVNNKPTPVVVKNEAPIIDTPTEIEDFGGQSSEEVVLDEPTEENTQQPSASSANPSTTKENENTSTPSKTDTVEMPTEAPDLPSAQGSAEKPTSTPVQTKPAPSAAITSGTYKVGTDISPGEYIVFSTGMTFLENSKDQSGNPDSIVFNIALDGRSHTYVTLLQGEYFTLDGGEMYPIATAPNVKPADGIYKTGQYKVGTDIPAGQLNLKVDNTSDIGFYEISKDSRQDMMDLIISDVVESETVINVVNGQYLTIRNAYIDIN